MEYQTKDYLLLTEPGMVIPIPEIAGTEADKLLSKAHPLNTGEFPEDNEYLRAHLVFDVLDALKQRKLEYKPAQDIVTLNIAEQIATKDGQTGLLEAITRTQDNVRRVYFR